MHPVIQPGFAVEPFLPMKLIKDFLANSPLWMEIEELSKTHKLVIVYSDKIEAV